MRRLRATTCLLAILAGFLYPVPALAPPMLDPEIVSMIGQIDSNRIATSIQTLVAFGTRNSCSDNSGTPPGIGAARDWIRAQFAALPGIQVVLDPFAGPCQTIQNVVAWIPGSGHPDRLIVIGGHYDSRTYDRSDSTSPAPGTNDSGSQTALVLEVARVLAGHSFDTTVIFVAWAGEEQGLYGSASFMQTYTTYFPTGTLELNLNCDIVGGDNTVNDDTALQQFRLFSPGTPREISPGDGTTDNTSPSRSIMRHVGYWGSAYVPEMTMLPQLREDRVGRGGDHESFIASAIPGVRFIEVNENLAHQHAPADLFDYVTPAYTSRVARVMAATLADLARASTPPQSMVATRLPGNMVRLTWAAPAAGPAVDYYVISARPVTENFYRTRFVVPGTATTADARVNEDLGIAEGADYFVSVAAVDGGGHESLYAYPEYRCGPNGCVVPDGALDVTATR